MTPVFSALPLNIRLAIAALFLSSAAAASSGTSITICNHCNSFVQLIQAATQASQLNASLNGVEDVYIVNVEARTIHAYRVSLHTDDPDPSSLGDEHLTLNIEAIEGKQQLREDLFDFIDIAHNFRSDFSSRTTIAALDLEFNSALDLIGGPLTDLNQRELENSLNRRFNQLENELVDITAHLPVVSHGLLNVRYALFSLGTGISNLVFPDATSVRAKVTVLKNLLNPEDFMYEISLNLDTIQTPGQNWIPRTAAHLEGFDFSTRNPELSQEFQDLLRRLGAEVQAPGGSSESEFCTTTISCSPNTSSPDEPEWRCQVSIEDC